MKRLFAAILLFQASLVVAQETPQHVELYGQVRDADGQPVASASLLLVAPPATPHQGVMFRRALDQTTPIAKVNSQTDADGNYRLRIDTSDTEWMQMGDGVLVAIGPNHTMTAIKYQLTRALVDLPLIITLPAEKFITARIVDSNGRPVAGAKVSPAKFAGIYLPFGIASQFSVVSDDDGNAKFSVLPERFESIYVASDLIGSQLLALSPSDTHLLQATAMPTQTIRMRAKHAADEQSTTVPDISWSLLTVRSQDEPLECVWQTAQTHGEEFVEVEHVATGQTLTVTDGETKHGFFSDPFDVQIGTGQEEVTVNVRRGIHVTGRVQSLVDGQPLARISIDGGGISQRHNSTADDGSYDAWLPDMNYSVYPHDPLGRFFNVDMFYSRPNPEHSPGEATVDTFELTPAATNVGRVIDDKGEPVAGATVRCEFKRERFSETVNLLTDRRGEFRFLQVGEGEPVTLSVFDKQGVTLEPTTVTLTPDARPVLRLSPATPIRFTGQVVDEQGQAVAGAIVEVMRGEVTIPARFSGAEYTAVDAFADRAENIVTDAHGHFETPELVDWKHHHSLKIRHSGFHDRLTSFRPIELKSDSATKFNFGSFMLRRIAPTKQLAITVTDNQDEPLADARLVVIQPRQASTTNVTDANGNVVLSVRQVPGVLAVAHQKAGTLFRTITGDESSVTLKIEAAAQNQPLAWPAHDSAKRIVSAKRVLETFGSMADFDIAAATDGEVACLAAALGFVDPPEFLRMAMATKAAIEKRDGVEYSIAEKTLKRNQTLAMIVMQTMPADQRTWHYRQRAIETTDPAKRRDLLVQALADARKTTGDEAATNIGRIANLFLAAGDAKTAIELVQEVYESQDDHEAALSAPIGEPQRSKRGVARYFYPQLALLDLDKALKLIHLHAYPNEIERLQALAALYAVAGGNTDWDTAMQKLNRTSFAGVEESLVPGSFDAAPLPSIEFVKEFATRLGDPTYKGVLLLHAAVKVPGATDDQRRELLQSAVDLLWQSNDRVADFYTTSVAYLLSDKIKSVAKIDSLLARRVAFECLWDLSRVQDQRYSYPGETYSPVAGALAGIDPQISRTLVEPFFADWTWMIRDRRTIYDIKPLEVAANIDPEWAADVALELMQGEFAQDRPRRAAVLDALVTGLAQSE